MGRTSRWLLLALASAGLGAEPEGPIVEEVWEAAHIDGARVGFLHTTVRAGEVDGKKRWHTTTDLDLGLRRGNALVRVRMEQGTEETEEGRVVAVFMRQHHAGGRQLVLNGTVEEGRLHVLVDSGRIERRIWWSEDVLGLRRQVRLFAERKPQAGARFAYLAYEPTVNAVVTRRVEVGVPEPVVTATGRRSLVRVEIRPDRLSVPGTSVQLPRTVLWLDDTFVAQRRQIELDGLGEVVLIRTTREVATAPAAGSLARVAEINDRNLIPLDRALPRVHSARGASYLVFLRGETDPAAAFVTDAHQDARPLRGEAFELNVHPVREPRAQGPAEPGPEFLAPSYYLDADAERIRELARRTGGPEAEPWQTALRIERWVHGAMRSDNAAPLAPASETAKTLRGDCRHYAFLTAALCRARGLPARIAVGLVYVERDRRPFLGFHMWTEVCIRGHWRGLDATLGRGGVGAGHLKVADHSWHDTRSLTPLLPVNRVLGKVSVTVLRVEGGE
jgi:transglutaminase-like putative cysteine protease